MSKRTDQQKARINVDDETWLAFRIEAMRHDRTVADWLGEIVRRQVSRIDRTDAADPTDLDSDPEPPAAPPRPKKPSIRLRDANVLDTFPPRSVEPPPWEV